MLRRHEKQQLCLSANTYKCGAVIPELYELPLIFTHRRPSSSPGSLRVLERGVSSSTMAPHFFHSVTSGHAHTQTNLKMKKRLNMLRWIETLFISHLDIPWLNRWQILLGFPNFLALPTFSLSINWQLRSPSAEGNQSPLLHDLIRKGIQETNTGLSTEEQPASPRTEGKPHSEGSTF